MTLHDVINPATEQVVAQVPSTSAEEAAAAVERAHRADPARPPLDGLPVHRAPPVVRIVDHGRSRWRRPSVAKRAPLGRSVHGSRPSRDRRATPRALSFRAYRNPPHKVVPMKIGVAKETAPGERRVALVPEALGKLTAAGLQVLVEKGAGEASFLPDAAYVEAGATVVSRDDLYKGADVVLRVAKPSETDAKSLRSGQVVVGLLQPLLDPKLMATLAKAGVTAISLDAIPRTLSRAQTMDALSSQANVGGYKAVLLAANEYTRYFPLLTTAAGTAKPANVLILGIGVAGLQAIGTARRLGAVVQAYDVRPETREQAQEADAETAMSKLAADKGCLACHQVDKKVVGPSYKDVANKYRTDKTAEAKLVKKVLEGGTGVWGQVPMPPNKASVNEKDATSLVKWVLSAK